MAGRTLRLGLAAALALGACVQDDGQRFNPIRDLTEVSVDDERELGMQFDRALQEQVEVVNDPIVTGFINDLGQSIVAQVEPQPFIYRFRVIPDPSLNAFAVPGGYIYFNSGTVLAADSVDELAGVMGHEIAHVKGHHYVRMRQATQIPDLLTGIAGIAAAVATREPGMIVAAQGINVAVGLKFSREMETEADHLGAIWLTRAGYDPAGITRFFERILEEKKRYPNSLPPYLFSHPDVEERIAVVARQAEQLRPQRGGRVSGPEGDVRGAEVREISNALPEVQTRLKLLIEARRASLPLPAPPPNRAVTDPLLRQARELAEAGEIDAALVTLARAELEEPYDPRVPFRIGALLEKQGRYQAAVEAYRRTARLDASRANVFYRLGMAYQRVGDRQRAVYALEQAALRLSRNSELGRRVDWEIEKLTFTIVPEAGFADGADGEGADTPAGAARAAFPVGAPRMVWWAQLGPHFASYAPEITVRWTAPDGAVVQEKAVERLRKPYVQSTLKFGPEGAGPPGAWAVEALLEGDVIDRRSVEVQAGSQSPR